MSSRPTLVPELSVRDWIKSKRFYCEVLGFDLKYERPEEGFAYFSLDQAELMIDQIGQGRDFHSAEDLQQPLGLGLNLQIEVSALDPILMRLEAAGLSPWLPVETKSYRVEDKLILQKQLIVADPDGYLLRFYQEE